MLMMPPLPPLERSSGPISAAYDGTYWVMAARKLSEGDRHGAVGPNEPGHVPKSGKVSGIVQRDALLLAQKTYDIPSLCHAAIPGRSRCM